MKSLINEEDNPKEQDGSFPLEKYRVLKQLEGKKELGHNHPGITESLVSLARLNEAEERK